MKGASEIERFSPFGTPVAGGDGLLWEVETRVFRCRMPASKAMHDAVSVEEAIQDPLAFPFFEMLVPKPAFHLLETTVAFFRGVIFQAGHSSEALLQLTCKEDQWKVRVPDQITTATRVTSGSVSAADKVGIEIHSHGTLPAYFSDTDDVDEVDGFIYGVLGDVTGWAPSFCFRVGHAGCFLDLNIDQVFKLPEGFCIPERLVEKDE